MTKRAPVVVGCGLRIVWVVCAAGWPAIGGCATGGPSKGAPWTILCLELQGRNRMQYVEQIADTLKQTPGIRPNDVFVAEESDGFARLYYGTYHRRTDPRTRKRPIPPKMRTDLEMVRQLGDDSGRRYFLRAMPVRMPMPDVGNPSWVLADVGAKYSLQVAVFEPTDDFWDYKETAAQFCELLRQKGYEAYYYHANASSMVTVGSFGPDAVATGPDGRTYYSSEVLALQRYELLKYNLVNGAIVRVRNDDGVMVPVPSTLVEIPHPSDLDLR